MTYSFEKGLKLVEQVKLRRAKTKARTKCNSDFNTQHMAETRDANAENASYTLLEKRVKEEMKKFQESKEVRNKKRGNSV